MRKQMIRTNIRGNVKVLFKALKATRFKIKRKIFLRKEKRD